MTHPNFNMLLRIAQGDAYGVATEYLKFPRNQSVKDQALRFERYGKHPVHNLKPGMYSDDTQMSCAITEALLHGDSVGQPTRKAFADSFVRCFKRDQREGYARGFQKLLEEVSDGDALLAKIKPDSDKNGAAMRSVPLGVLKDLKEIRTVTHEHARITHDTDGGFVSALAVALMSHYALWTDEPLCELPGWMVGAFARLGVEAPLFLWAGGSVQAPGPEEAGRWNGVGMRTASAVMTLVSEERSLLDIARRTIEWGGDTDSVLAIAWGIASARMTEPLPDFFESGLENGRYGRDYLKKLGYELVNRYYPFP